MTYTVGDLVDQLQSLRNPDAPVMLEVAGEHEVFTGQINRVIDDNDGGSGAGGRHEYPVRLTTESF